MCEQNKTIPRPNIGDFILVCECHSKEWAGEIARVTNVTDDGMSVFVVRGLRKSVEDDGFCVLTYSTTHTKEQSQEYLTKKFHARVHSS